MNDAGTTTGQTLHDALQELKDALDAESQRTPAGEVSDAIDQRLDSLDQALTALNQADMAQRTIDLNAAADSIRTPLEHLDQLKADIQAIANDMAKANKVLGVIDTLVEKAATLVKP